MAGDKARASFALADDANDVLAVQVAGVAEEGLVGVVVVFGTIFEEPVVAADGPARQLGLDGPAGEGAGALANVNLGVVADAQANAARVSLPSSSSLTASA